MKLLRATAVAAAIFVLAPPPPASAQISSTAIWSCEFVNSATDCGFNLEAFASNRATVVSPGRDDSTAAELTTQPGDSNLFGSGTAERADVNLGISAAYCNQGQDEWWAHSLMFPQNYVIPPAGSVWNWGVVFDFHHTGSTGQPTSRSPPSPPGSSSGSQAARPWSMGRPIRASTESRSARSPRTSGTTSCIT